MSAEASEPLRSPYHTVQHFLISVGNAKKDSAAYQDAMECLDFSLVDTKDFEARAGYVDKLYVLLEHLRATGQFDREALPKEPPPELESQPIGNDPFQLIMVRSPEGRWRFRARTVIGVPAMVTRLEAQRAQETAEPRQRPLAAAAPAGTLSRYQFRPGHDEPVPHRYERAGSRDGGELFRSVPAWRDRSQPCGVLAGKLWLALNRYS